LINGGAKLFNITRPDSIPVQIKTRKKLNKKRWRIAPFPRKRKNKFPVAGPWRSRMPNSWRFPHLPAPTRTESECLVFTVSKSEFLWT
jgi:hypothetical protein